MNAPTARGWCPSLMTPMEAGDGFLVRIKPRAATLTAEQAAAVAEASGRYGNGIVELTNRGHLQVRGLAKTHVEDFVRTMADIGLAGTSPRGEAVKNVLADPLGPDDPAAHFDSHRLARRLGDVLEGDPDLHGLPDKFGLLVDAGVALPLAGCTADIMVLSEGDAAIVALDGGDRLLLLPLSAVEDAVHRLLTAFLSWMNGQGRRDTASAPRMRLMVAANGADGVFRAAGLHGETRPDPGPGKPAKRSLPGFVPMADGPRGYFLAAARFGSLESETLADLAELARTFSDGTIRITPWKAVLLWGVLRTDAPSLRDRASKAGFIVEPDDPRARIVTCAGYPRCASSNADTRSDAAFIAATGSVPKGLLHISGCTKGCAHPSPAPVALVATAVGYDLIRNGRPVDPPERTGLTPEEAARALAPTLGFDGLASGR